MNLSVTAPLDTAFKRTGKLLFKPFDSGIWFKLGFCAFLTQLADCSGGGSNGLSNGFNGSGRSFEHELDRFTDWFAANQALILSLGLVVVLLALAVMVLLVWLQSRGRFMLLDGVVRERGAVSEPWHAYRSEGNSLFRFVVVITIVGSLIGLVALSVGVALAWSDIRAERFGGGAVAGLVLGGGLLFINAVIFGLISLFTKDFVVPAMYKRRVGALQAWRIVLDEVLRPHLGMALLYVLMKILIGFATAMVALLLMCGTIGIACCIMAIPYLGTVLLLPLFVFDRSYSIAFLEQLGASWQLAPESAVPVAPTV